MQVYVAIHKRYAGTIISTEISSDEMHTEHKMLTHGCCVCTCCSLSQDRIFLHKLFAFLCSQSPSKAASGYCSVCWTGLVTVYIHLL